MRTVSTLIILIFIPLYVLGTFVTFVFAPVQDYTIEEIKENIVNLVFVGDMMFDRYVRMSAENNGYEAIFDSVRAELLVSDVLVGNLEGPITTFPPVSKPNGSGVDHYRFTFATTVAKALYSTGFTGVLLANNHIQNFGISGIEQTKENLAKWDIDYIGTPDESYQPWRGAVDSTHIVMYAFDIWHARDVSILEAKIKDEPEDYFVTVYAHWGDEYEKLPNNGQIEIAHKFIDAGADFVVGSHPHVIQPKELYKDKWIYYSLGNFVFDQYFNPDVLCGAIVKLQIEENNMYTVTESFSELQRDGTTVLSDCMVTIPFLGE